MEPAVDRLPILAGVVGAKRACGGDGDDNALGIAWIDDDRLQAHAAGAGLPRRTGAVAAQPGNLVAVLPTVGRAEERGVLDAGVNRVGIIERRLEMPHALELPRMRRAVVPLMRRERLAS